MTYIPTVCNCDRGGVPLTITSYYPVLATLDVPAAADYFQRMFRFVPRFVSDWYVHLDHPDHDFVALALVAHDYDTVPALNRRPAQGVVLNLEVADVDAEYVRLTAADAEVLVPIKDEDFGQRHFIVRGPDGVLVDVITPIPPTRAFASAYLGGAA